MAIKETEPFVWADLVAARNSLWYAADALGRVFPNGDDPLMQQLAEVRRLVGNRLLAEEAKER